MLYWVVKMRLVKGRGTIGGAPDVLRLVCTYNLGIGGSEDVESWGPRLSTPP